MERFFSHAYFEDGVLQSGGQTLSLTTSQIAGAAMREIIQLELSASPFDIFMTDLLDSTTDDFRWVAQLGQIRETRTALSGLFGRFVARAYLTHHAGFQFFEPIQGNLATLDAWPDLTFHRDGKGDLPDWIVAPAPGQGSIAIAEAKGSHNGAGPWAALDQARAQARRVKVMSDGAILQVKRYALATRWAVADNPRLATPYLWVDDPEDGERAATITEHMLLHRGVGLGHFAAFARGMGFGQTAQTIAQARQDRPGFLDLDASDLVLVETQAGLRAMMVVAITPGGVVRMPPGPGGAFQTGLRAVFGEDVHLLGIDAKTILSVDQLDAFAEAAPGRRDFNEADLIEAPARRDGMEVLDLDAVALIGRGVPIDLGPALG
ncbi:hypothetical protein [Caulobacter sp.]|uniref:hypothetical protein n=1 Tax=Caulobacter sp. TaxID=78 RepID=UPI0031D53BE5